MPSIEDLAAGVDETLVFESDDEIPLLSREVSFWDDGTPIIDHQQNVRSIGTGVQTNQPLAQAKKTSVQDNILAQINEAQLKIDASPFERDANHVSDSIKHVEEAAEASEEVTPSPMTLLCGKDGCECLIKHPRKPRILLMGQRQ